MFNIEEIVNKIHNANCIQFMKQIPNKTIDMIITSPPYWSLRDYNLEGQIWDGESNCKHIWGNESIKSLNLQCGNPEFKRKWREQVTNLKLSQGKFCIKCGAWYGSLGLEPFIDMYIKHLCDIFDETKRILKETGTFWINIGDTYGGSNSRASNNGRAGFGNKREGCFKRGMAKSLCGIPERFVIEMYNRGWIRRNTIIWQKPNCMPSSSKDKFTTDFEYLYLFTKNKKYYFEQQFDPYTKPMNRWGGEKLKANGKSSWDKGTGQTTYRERNMRPNPKGRNKRCVWVIPSRALKKSNFASYPEKLLETPIKAGCPQNGIVLDPFLGTGTTAIVAKKLGRNFIGLDLSKESCEIGNKRLSKKLI